MRRIGYLRWNKSRCLLLITLAWLSVWTGHGVDSALGSGGRHHDSGPGFVPAASIGTAALPSSRLGVLPNSDAAESGNSSPCSPCRADILRATKRSGLGTSRLPQRIRKAALELLLAKPASPLGQHSHSLTNSLRIGAQARHSVLLLQRLLL